MLCLHREFYFLLNRKEECINLCLNSQEFECRSANYEYSNRVCLLFDQDRYSNPNLFRVSINIDYLENQCSTRM